MEQHPARWVWLRSFLSELKRRKVFRVGVGYGAVAFVVWQAAEFVLPALGFPGWSVDLVVVLSLLGFPVAIVLAWAFEVTPEGVRTTLPAASERAPVPGVDDEGRSASRPALMTGGLAVGLGFLAFGGYALLRAVVPSGDEVREIRSLAVLPLENLAPDPDAEQYFADGMTEALTSELGQISALTVISRTSATRARETDRSMPEIAQELGVEGLIEGSVRRAGDEVDITIQLVDGPTSRLLWSESYRRNLRNVLALQSEVARAIADQIEVTLTPEGEARLASARPVDPEGYRHWLRGNYLLTQLNEEAYVRALDAYEEALAIDSTYAPAYAGMAQAYVLLGGWWSTVGPTDMMPRAEAAAGQALALDSTLADAHIALGRYRWLFEWDWAGAERAFRRGMELNPSSTIARIVYQNFLTIMGRFEESINVGRRTLQLDPLSPQAHNELGFAHWHAGRYEEAVRMYEDALEIDPEFAVSHTLLALLYAHRGVGDEALAHLRMIPYGATSLPSSILGIYGYVLAAGGQETEARDLLSRLRARRDSGYVPARAVADAYLGLGEHREALRWLERAHEERDISLVWIFKLPVYDPLRSEPRFQDLLPRMDFPEE